MDSTYQLGKNALDASSLRQQVIAHNVANANTEGYKAKKVSFEDELKQSLGINGLALTGTNNRHINTASQLSTITGTVYETNDNTFMNLDGNNVDVELEMANMAANQLQYSTLIRQVSEKIESYRTVIKG